MAELTGANQVAAGNTDQVDTTQLHRVGMRMRDRDGYEYIYLVGVASTAANTVVTYTTAGATALLTANAVGDVAVAMAATVASTWGWYMIKGFTSAKCDTVAANKACFIDATDGRIDDAVVTGDLVVGMYTRSTDTSNVCTVQLNYPLVTDVLG